MASILQVPDWNVALYNLNNDPIMDISDLVSFSLRMRLNDSANVQFRLDLDKFERRCALINAEPKTILYPASTELKISRNGNLLFGGIIATADSVFDVNSKTLEVTADSYLEYFSKRLLSKTYEGVERSEIAWDAIDTVQSEDYGSLGITQGTLVDTYESVLTADYRDVKSIIQLYTYAQPTTYDFEITPNKVFNTYLHLGSERPEIQLVYPYNITSMKIPRSSDSLYNQIIGLGSGIGEERIQAVVQDIPSKIRYRVRENKVLYNSVVNQDTLIENLEGELVQAINVLELPEITVSGDAVDLDLVRVGDSVYVRSTNSTYNNDLEGMFRIYEMNITVSSDVSETVSIKFYNPDSGGAIQSDL